MSEPITHPFKPRNPWWPCVDCGARFASHAQPQTEDKIPHPFVAHIHVAEECGDPPTCDDTIPGSDWCDDCGCPRSEHPQPQASEPDPPFPNQPLPRYLLRIEALAALIREQRQAGREERDAVIADLRRKLALAGVEGSPPVGETTISVLLLAIERRVEIIELALRETGIL